MTPGLWPPARGLLQQGWHFPRCHRHSRRPLRSPQAVVTLFLLIKQARFTQPREGSSCRHPPQTGAVRAGAPFKDNTETHTAFMWLPPHTSAARMAKAAAPDALQGRRCRRSPCIEAAPCPPSLKVKGGEGKGKEAKTSPGRPAGNALPPLPRSSLGMLPARCHPKRDGGPSSTPPPYGRIAATPPRRSGPAASVTASVASSVSSSPFPGRNPLPPGWSPRGRSRKAPTGSAGVARDPPAPAGAQGSVCRAGAPPRPAEFASAPPLPVGEGSRDRRPRRCRSGGPGSPFPAGAGWRGALALTVRHCQPGRGPCPQRALPEAPGTRSSRGAPAAAAQSLHPHELHLLKDPQA